MIFSGFCPILNLQGCKYIPEDLQTEEICKIAVQERGYLLKYVKNQTEEICKLAVQEWEGALEYVKDEYKN